MPDKLSDNAKEELATGLDALAQLKSLEDGYKKLKAHTLGYVVTHVSDPRPDGSETHNFYFSITTPATPK